MAEIVKTKIVKIENIVLDMPAETHEDAIRRCGRMLVESGYAAPRYVDGMLARDRDFSTAIGNHIAIPHGAKEYKDDILETGLVVVTYPDGIDWNGQKVHLVIGIAAQGNDHLDILENIVSKLEDDGDVLALVNARDKNAVYAMLTENPA
jgi:mannitol/fructose-specific phosphotransferase system IIA component